jgi:hypothetical protein
VVDHQADDQGVVQVDPVGHLLSAVELADRQSRQMRNVAVEPRPIARRHFAIGHAMHPVRADPDIAHQKCIPLAMVDPAGRIGIVGEPAIPQFGGRSRMPGGAAEGHEQPEDWNEKSSPCGEPCHRAPV